ncbi:GGDEF domain-containing protein [bacterium]|nr:GGDEF domain-containing protein [bacterium]
MSVETLLRIEIDLFALAILAIIGTSVVMRSRDHRFIDSKLFLLLIASVGLVIVSEGATWVVDGLPGTAGRIAGYVVNSIFYALIMIPMGIYLVYVDHFTAPGKPLFLSPFFWTAIAFAFMGIVFAAVSPLKGLLFYLDEGNIYHRGPMNSLFNLLMTFMGLLPACLLLKRRRNISSASFLNLILYPIMPTIGGILQVFIYGTNLFWAATVIAVLLTFVNVQNRQIDNDYLTGTFNRSSLQEYLAGLLRRARGRQTFSGIMLDLDYFKQINDRCGHSVGDQALIEMAAILHASVRKTDFVARYGGDEFIVILETGDPLVLDEVLARIKANIAASNRPSKPYALSASMGRAIFDLELDRNFDIFIKRLDRLMYEDKARLAIGS